MELARSYQWRYVKLDSSNQTAPKDHNGIIFRNIGPITVKVNGAVLNPGDRLTLDGHKGENDTTVYGLSWDIAGGGLMDCWVKEYKG